MRGMAVGGIVSMAILTACGLGVVDVPAEPGPAELFVTSEIGVDPDDPSRVQVMVTATLDPGIGLDGAPRELASDILGVEGTDYSPSGSDASSDLMWVATESYDAPGPEAVRLRLPRPEGLGLADAINMRVRVDVAPEPVIPLDEGEDLLIRAEPPSNPAETLEWWLELTSPSDPDFLVRMGGDESWPSEVRVPGDQIPLDALPIEATLRVRWDRALTLFELTPDERYDLALRSIMTVAWTVEAAGEE